MKEEGGQQVGKRTLTFRKESPSILSSLLPFLYLSLSVEGVRVLEEEDHKPT